MSLEIDVLGRVQNIELKPKQCLLPLFEAIMNSIHAIRESETSDGRIDVFIHRDGTYRPLPPEEVLYDQPIIGFEVHDNGVGFTDSNFQSFKKSDSTRKSSIGGKGVGRLLWLKAFDKAEVTSTFRDNGHVKRRTFTFDLRHGVANKSLKRSKGTETKTAVRLVQFKREYREMCPVKFETIAHRIIEHFVQFFVLGSCPKIVLHDERERSETVLNHAFQNDFQIGEKSVIFEVNGQKLRLRHVRISSQIAPKHQLLFCANNRPVVIDDASKYVSHLKGPLIDPSTGRRFTYAAYVTGQYLTTNVSPDRTRFTIDQAPDEQMLIKDGEPTWECLIRNVAKRVRKHLRPYVEPMRQAHVKRVTEFVERNPRYRYVLKHRPKWIDKVPPNLDDEGLDLELHKLSLRFDVELKETGQKLFNQRKLRPGESAEKHKDALKHYLEAWNESGQAKLADYVVYRKATLKFLRECLRQYADGKYELEDVVHDTIFPMKATSDDLSPEHTNLWVVNETLAYHYYLASDLELAQVSPIRVVGKERRRRSDLLVFHKYEAAVALVDSQFPFDSVTIVEFKRPSRDDYSDDDNPIDQVERYIELLQENKAYDKNGEELRLKPGTPFNAYIVCSITSSLERIAKRRGFHPMPDGQGFFKHHPTLFAYEEIVSYQKLISDAERRNKIFFQMLNMS